MKKKTITTIQDLLEVLQQIKEDTKEWTASVTIYADGSGKFYAGAPEDDDYFFEFGNIQKVSASRSTIQLIEA
jgi:hypothetical protein